MGVGSRECPADHRISVRGCPTPVVFLYLALSPPPPSLGRESIREPPRPFLSPSLVPARPRAGVLRVRASQLRGPGCSLASVECVAGDSRHSSDRGKTRRGAAKCSSSWPAHRVTRSPPEPPCGIVAPWLRDGPFRGFACSVASRDVSYSTDGRVPNWECRGPSSSASGRGGGSGGEPPSQRSGTSRSSFPSPAEPQSLASDQGSLRMCVHIS